MDEEEWPENQFEMSKDAVTEQKKSGRSNVLIILINGFELVCIEIQPVKASRFLVIAWYRPPSELAAF